MKKYLFLIVIFLGLTLGGFVLAQEKIESFDVNITITPKIPDLPPINKTGCTKEQNMKMRVPILLELYSMKIRRELSARSLKMDPQSIHEPIKFRFNDPAHMQFIIIEFLWSQSQGK